MAEYIEREALYLAQAKLRRWAERLEAEDK